jgi:hypothetical protein
MFFRFFVLCVAMCSFFAPAMSVASTSSLDALSALAPEEAAWVDDLPRSSSEFGRVKLVRVDVYATNARVLVVERAGLREISRSAWRHYVSDSTVPDAPQLALSIAPDSHEATGLLIENNAFFDVRGVRVDTTWRWHVARTPEHTHAVGDAFCAGTPAHADTVALPTQRALIDTAAWSTTLRQAIVAVDTDNELLQRRFGNRQNDARDFIGQLFAQLNLMFERDLRLRLVQGLVILRPSSMSDPYVEPANGSTARSAQLHEVALWWQQNQRTTERAFVAMLSGKAFDAELNSGIAWLLGSGNYCSLRGSGGAYSFNLLRTASGSTPAGEVRVVGHEIGHNLGAPHTHCTDTDAQAPGLQPIDRCYSGENAQGCYVGPIGCQGGPGTIMSYCDAGGSAQCGLQQRFAPFHVQLLNARIAENFPSCITPLGMPDFVFGASFE